MADNFDKKEDEFFDKELKDFIEMSKDGKTAKLKEMLESSSEDSDEEKLTSCTLAPV